MATRNKNGTPKREANRTPPGRANIMAPRVTPSGNYPALEEIGTTGLMAMGGRVYEEMLPDLWGIRWRRAVREMTEGDPIIGAILFAVEMLSRQVSWSILPKDASPEAHDIAVFVDECLNDMLYTWPDTLSEILTMLPWGWYWAELCYKRRLGEQDLDDPEALPSSKYNDGKIGWDKFAARAQETLYKWDIDDRGIVRGMVQQAAPHWIPTYLPISKALLFRTSVRKGNPEGFPILRRAYGPWYYKNNMQRIEAVGVERDLAGLPIALVPARVLDPKAPPDLVALRETIKNLLLNIRRDEQEGVMFPSDKDQQGHLAYELKLLSTGGRRQFATGDIIERYDERIAMCVLADFLMLGHGRTSRGSYALSVDKTEMFSIALGAWLDSLCGTINEDGIPRLLRLNGMDTALAPKLAHGQIEAVDLKALGDYIESVAKAGALIITPQLRKALLEQANLPVPSDDVLAQIDDQIREQINANQEAGLDLTQAVPAGGQGSGNVTDASQQAEAARLAAAAGSSNG